MVGCGLAAAGVLGADRAFAEKNKPGLFDFEKWQTPGGREKEAAGQFLPG